MPGQGMPDNGDSENSVQESTDTPNEKELTREEKQKRLREKIKEKRENR